LGYNLADDDSCGFTAPGDLVVADAMLGPLADNGGSTNTHALLPGSLAIDVGSPGCPPPSTDQRGVPRPQGAGCDIGAFESGATPPPTPTPTATPLPTPTPIASPSATTFPVTKTEDTDDGACGQDCSLREAIEAANANPGADDVPIPAGNYLLALGQLVVSDAVNIAGAGLTHTIVVGNGTDRVFLIEETSGVVSISGVTIQNGRRYGTAGDGGGGIRNNGDLTLSNSTVSNNRVIGRGSGGGGGIKSPGNLTLTNTTVSDNYVYRRYGGGGGGIRGSGNLTLTNSTVNNNSAAGRSNANGGGIYQRGGDLTLSNSTVSGNNVYGLSSDGGGITSYSGDLALTNSTVTNNSVVNEDGGNYPSEGGGILNLSGSFTLADTIVADNSILYPGIGPNCSSSTGVISLGYNLADDDSCGFTAPGDLVVADAMLGPLQANGGPTETHDLLVGSPAIDAGSVDCPPPATDQRGVARPLGAACDIGAVESVPEPRGSLALIAGAGFLGFLYRRRR
jgi:CSLREA domain-containing protein